MNTQQQIDEHNNMIERAKVKMHQLYRPKGMISGPDKTHGLNFFRKNPPITSVQLLSISPIKDLEKGLKRSGGPMLVHLPTKAGEICCFSVYRDTETDADAKKNGYKYNYVFKYETP